MEGDRGIIEGIGGTKFELPKTIANGDDVCQSGSTVNRFGISLEVHYDVRPGVVRIRRGGLVLVLPLACSPRRLAPAALGVAVDALLL